MAPGALLCSVSGRFEYTAVFSLNSSRPPWVGPKAAVLFGAGSVASGGSVCAVHANGLRAGSSATGC